MNLFFFLASCRSILHDLRFCVQQHSHIQSKRECERGKMFLVDITERQIFTTDLMEILFCNIISLSTKKRKFYFRNFTLPHIQ